MVGGNGLVHTENFTIAPLLDSEFNTNDGGWYDVGDSGWRLSKGKWNVYGANSLKDMYTANLGPYTDLDYQVNLSLQGDRYAALDIQSITIHSTFDWYNIFDGGYIFSIRGLGTFSVSRVEDGWWDDLQPWTYSSAIKKSTTTTNTLRVVANGSTMYFYINGQFVWVGTDGSISDGGEVGIGLWYYDPGDLLSADWALIYNAPAFQLHALPSVAQQALNQAAVNDISSAGETKKPVGPGPKR
jgi:hypothetical protein